MSIIVFKKDGGLYATLPAILCRTARQITPSHFDSLAELREFLDIHRQHHIEIIFITPESSLSLDEIKALSE